MGASIDMQQPALAPDPGLSGGALRILALSDRRV